MENVTFVYALATEQERQTEALKNQQQNQLEKYRHVIQRQKKKERAFLSFKKVEFLSRQETKLNVLRPSSARARMDDKLPEVTRKGREIALKKGLLATGNEFMNVLPLYRQKNTHWFRVCFFLAKRDQLKLISNAEKTFNYTRR